MCHHRAHALRMRPAHMETSACTSLLGGDCAGLLKGIRRSVRQIITAEGAMGDRLRGRTVHSEARCRVPLLSWRSGRCGHRARGGEYRGGADRLLTTANR